jgi:hypothetical protein
MEHALQRIPRILSKLRSRSQITNQETHCTPAKSVLKDSGEFRISVWDARLVDQTCRGNEQVNLGGV